MNRGSIKKACGCPEERWGRCGHPSVWKLRVSAGRKPSGKRWEPKETFRGPRRDAERRLTEMQRASDAGTLADPGRMLLGDFLADYVAHADIRDRTRLRYQQLLRKHVAPAIGLTPLAKVDARHVRAVMRSMAEAGLSDTTRLQTYAVIRAAFRAGISDGTVATNPVARVRPPKRKDPELSIPSWAEVIRIIEASDGTMRLVFTLLATTGARRSEILGLRWRETDLNAGALTITRTAQVSGTTVVFAEATKSKGSRRTIPLPASTVAALRTYRARQSERRLMLGDAWQDNDLVLDRGDGQPMHPDVVSRHFQRLARRLGLGARLHDLRHAHATHLLLSGVPVSVVSERLGHADPGFTLRTYGHVLEGAGRIAADVIERAMAGVGE